MPVPQIISDDVRNGEKFGRIGFVFEHWAIIGAPYYDTCKGRDYFIEDIMGPKKIIQNFRQAMVVMVIGLVKVCQFVEKTCLLEKHGRTMEMIIMAHT